MEVLIGMIFELAIERYRTIGSFVTIRILDYGLKFGKVGTQPIASRAFFESATNFEGRLFAAVP